MEENLILNKLNQARRPLDSLSQVKILTDWQFDETMQVWYLRINISVESEISYILRDSQWYLVVSSEYPKGKLKMYPDIENGIKVTLNHQSNNSKIVKNGLWRSGALCLEKNTLNNFQSEPHGIDDRLLYHVKRSVSWLELAAKGQLISDNEPFELPEFTLRNTLDKQFAFSEDVVTFMQWESTECKYGIAELDVYKSNPFTYYVKIFKSLVGTSVHYTKWGKQLEAAHLTNLIKAPWVLLNQPPVINEWQAPETFGDLIDACNNQNVDIVGVLEKVVSKIRDGKRHLFLLGFPIPKYFGGEPEIIFWNALYLPVVSQGKKTANGFRNNNLGWWRRDKCEVFNRSNKIDWIDSENWNQQEISTRGKMNDQLLRKRILLVGGGCIGASIAEILVRSGLSNLTIMDNDLLSVGNLSRHTLNLNDIGGLKEVSLCKYLNSLNPHANVDVIKKLLSNDSNLKTNTDLEKYDIILECTGENNVLDIFQNINFKKKHIFVSVSVGLGAKRLYMTLMNGNSYDFTGFYDLIFPYIEKEKKLFSDFNLPRNGIGCWNPTFPGRSDDVWLAAATSVKAIENYFTSKSKENLSLVYEQKDNSGIFEGYQLVEKREDG
ncbi:MULTISPECIES: ThiF family adenylyltransferase [unclassified Acetobacterium]|jgi:molybdopterin/thiamine biosynthesis adenylyltransferase|uniref:ThiF family adenylyltransferase n=1 Tax=unclassified Acetobacterium TaxID=2638182 RepID=UPI000DBEC513|nr:MULTISPECIES: ThiF family adenylyltransferase [unclassified Acetobacterium]AWW28445.1 ThiF family adenylyltransferase [Acetobacterium sp. KB-1]MDZ5726800.1 ThiF family adenylyltransferase [Acetobacterium sp. K1/6]